MGRNIAHNAVDHGHGVVGFDPHPPEEAVRDGLELAVSMDELVSSLAQPRIVLIYVPHGPPTHQVCDKLRSLLATKDVAVDGGNSHWQDSQRRHDAFADRGIFFLDVGTSGGIPGARHGACFMAGGDPDGYRLVEPLLRDLAVDERGVVFVGAPGSGHFVKLIHNAIEFGMVQAIAEGVELLKRSEFDLDLPALFDNWSHGSVIRSWLVELMRDALEGTPDLDGLATYVEDTGEVKWVLRWALEHDIPAPVVFESQQLLLSYRDLEWPAAKAVALLRHAFGGHPLHTADERLARV
jgi:6-phosphogluconate dehydrogenase